uniref:Uncharacterized protein n=1 Tax=Chenopodium quinoa TaxID=63459 RepID=A0A803MBC9_CHEQI
MVSSEDNPTIDQLMEQIRKTREELEQQKAENARIAEESQKTAETLKKELDSPTERGIRSQRFKMMAYLEAAKKKAKQFSPFTIKQIPRDKNTQADALANLGSALRKSPFSTIPLVHLQRSSVDTSQIPDVATIDATPNWTTQIIQYLRNDVLPNDPLEARKIRYKASRYTIKHDVLFKISSTGL